MIRAALQLTRTPAARGIHYVAGRAAVPKAPAHSVNVVGSGRTGQATTDAKVKHVGGGQDSQNYLQGQKYMQQQQQSSSPPRPPAN